jgi:uncharacterized surface anchored protein
MNYNLNVSYPNGGCGCDHQQSDKTITRIPNGDSFKITYQFMYETMEFRPIDLNLFDFKVQYFTLGNEDKHIEFTKPPISDGKCIIDNIRGVLTFIFLNYNLPNGNLYGKYTFRLPPDPMYGYSPTEEYTKFTGVQLI